MFYKFFNLQLMATDMEVLNNTNVTTDSGLSAENKTFYDRALIEEAGPELVHDQFGQKRPIPKNGGKTIEFRQYADLPKALTPLTEGVTPQGKKLTVTATEATVSQYGDYVCLSDVLDLTAIDNNVLEATKAVGKQAGLTLDTVTRNVLQAGSNVWYAPKADGTAVTSRANLTLDCVLTVDLVRDVVAYFKSINAPRIGSDYVCILHPYVARDLMDDPKWENPKDYCDPQDKYSGELGRVSGCRFVEASESKIYEGTADSCPTGLAVFGCLFLAANAYGITEIAGGGLTTIIKQLGSAGTADPLNQRSTVGWKAIKTAERLIEAYMVRVECCSSASKKAKKN